MAESCETMERILLQSDLELDFKQSVKKARVTLTPKYVALEHLAKPNNDDSLLDVKPCKQDVSVLCQVIPLDEVITVQPHVTAGKDKFKMYKGYQSVEMQPQQHMAFDIYFVKRAAKHRWRHKALTITCGDHMTCSKWIDTIKDVISAPGFSRPKRLLVFVNPYGGKKRAPRVFEKVRHFFELAGVMLEVIETQRQYHAKEILQDRILSDFDGVVCVGGDGTFSEVLNGVLDRCQIDERVSQTFRHQPARPRLRIGVIPAGSTDSVVCSTIGTNDPTTSALQIILGCSVGVDVNALYKEDSFVKYSVTMTSYGYYGDLLADSERLRWMGPKRYKWSGLKKFVLNKSYEGEVSFLPADESSGHPQDGSYCYAGCEMCQRAAEADQKRRETAQSTSGATFDLGSEGMDRGAITHTDGWQQVRGRFVAINAVSVSCRCPLSPEGMSPYTHLGDGCIDLILISDCSRIDYLRHLMRIPSQSSDQFDFNFVQVYRVREFQFQPDHSVEGGGKGVGGREMAVEPTPGPSGASTNSQRFLTVPGSGLGSHSRLCSGSGLGHRDNEKSLKHSASQNSNHSVWNCDGEVLEHPHLHIQVHCQLIRMFARGVEDLSKLDIEKCPVCFNPCTRC